MHVLLLIGTIYSNDITSLLQMKIFFRYTVPITYVLHLLALQPARSDCATSGVTPSSAVLVLLPRVKPFNQWHSLVKGQGKGLSCAKGNVKCKEIVLEVYDVACVTLNNINFGGCALVLLMALRSAEEDRRNVDSDTTLKVLGDRFKDVSSARSLRVWLIVARTASEHSHAIFGPPSVGPAQNILLKHSLLTSLHRAFCGQKSSSMRVVEFVCCLVFEGTLGR